MIQKIVSLTSQNQITIPVEILNKMSKDRPKKLLITWHKEEMKLKPMVDFRSLRGSLKSNVKLTDKQLREARAQFEKKWADKV